MSAPRKGLSLRAQARLKRENRELRARLNEIVNGGYPGTVVSRMAVGAVELATIRTAHRLGYSIVVRDNSDGTIALHAVSRTLP